MTIVRSILHDRQNVLIHFFRYSICFSIKTLNGKTVQFWYLTLQAANKNIKFKVLLCILVSFYRNEYLPTLLAFFISPLHKCVLEVLQNKIKQARDSPFYVQAFSSGLLAQKHCTTR